ncbi:MAG: hypothetical protein HYX72_07280 [Acidobacteria bacterium]|nr:hypothetical protein [Acidobacteriota bacterium]
MMPYLYVLVAIVLRLLPHPWNVTPMAAMFFFSGATFRSKRDSLLVPFAALLLSDFAVVHFLYKGTYAWFSPYTWAGFLIIGVIGWALRDRITLARVAAGSLAGSLLFFLITNFGVWASEGMYPHTWQGLTTCYIAALPFFRNSVLGDLAYTALMFGSYEWLRHRRMPVAAAAR